MIRIELPWLIFAYLLVFLAGIFAVWIAYEVVRRVRDSRNLRNRLQCAMCGMVYEDRTSNALPPCPRCGSPNERSRIRIY